ncbi:MAG: hypothetical protein ABR549_08595 [Mycobacteriales bacterium]
MNVDDLIGTAVAFLGMLLLAGVIGVLVMYNEPKGALVLAVPGLLLAVQGIAHSKRATRPARR